jgi:hypothetical protein
MGADVIILCFAHLHFVLQNLGHRSDSFAVTVHGNGVYVFGKQVIVFLFFEVTLIIHQVVGSIQILGLQIFAGIFLCQSQVFNVYCSFPGFVAFIQSVKDRDAQ